MLLFIYMNDGEYLWNNINKKIYIYFNISFIILYKINYG